MKHLHCLALFFITFGATCQTPEKTSGTIFGIKGGANISFLSAAINSELRAKAGLNIGFFMKSRTGKMSFIRTELYYSNQGQRNNYVFRGGGPSIGTTRTILHYVNVPILFEFGKKLSVQAGGQIGVLLKSTEKGTVESLKVDNNLNSFFQKTDLALVLGVGYAPKGRLSYGARFNYGVANIYNHSSQQSSFPAIANRVFHFYVAWSF